MPNEKNLSMDQVVELRRLICAYVTSVERWQPLIYTINKSCLYSAEHKHIVSEANRVIYADCARLQEYIDSLTEE